MPSHSELPGFLPRKKLIKALHKIGFEINVVGGKGCQYGGSNVFQKRSKEISEKDLGQVAKGRLYVALFFFF